ncbi:clathrin light chain [Obelidium mucronatum]|nr:clathrin light chain [Obelidium mucronatum]
MDPTEEDFLARERALLGDDALLFGNPGVAAAPEAGGGADFGAFESGAFESGAAFAPAPLFDNATFAAPSFDNAAPLFGAAEPANVFDQQPLQSQPMEFFSGAAASPAAGVPNYAAEVEPDAVRAWRENFEMSIADRDAKSYAKNEETSRSAKESLDRFYAEYNDKKQKTIARNKENEKSAAAREETTSGNIWERVVKQIDTSASGNPAGAKLKEKLKESGKDDGKASKKPAAKSKDTTRMKSLLISLKADKNAPSHDIQ